jgi:outer membrane protein assembly factor BamB
VVYIRQPGVLRALQLDTGQPAWPGPPAAGQPLGTIYRCSGEPFPPAPTAGPIAGVSRYCVTIANHYLLARMGDPWTGVQPSATGQAPPRSFLVGLDIRTQKVLFERIVPPEPGWQFEAAPLADEAHIYVSLRRRDPVSSQVAVHCYSLGTGRLVWARELARAAPLTDAPIRRTHSPLALRDGTLYYNSNLGVVAAVRATDGRVQWVCRYPRRGVNEDHPDRQDRYVLRDLVPCLIYQDLVIAAPADCQRILALDSATGRVLWTTPAGQAGDAVHLLGVGHGHLFASGDSLYWIDVASGAVVGRFPAGTSPAHEFARPSPRGFGRGVLAGHWVYWPTGQRLYVLDQRQPRMVRQPIDLAAIGMTGGNLVIVEGILLIAATDRLSAWNETGRGQDP